MEINDATWNFVRQHVDDDVRQLALRGTKEAEVDLTLALQQIAGRQTAKRKLPTWAAVDGIIFPPHLNMEQCSSEQAARYKANIANRLSAKDRFVDLTGGLGVDFYFMSQDFQERCYMEQDADLCAIAEHNFRLLGLSCSVRQGSASVLLPELPHASVIYLDPARRNEHGGRTYGIEDCTPNVLELMPLLMQKAQWVMLKLSPMLDWHKAVEQLKFVREVHIVSVDNECKELLLILSHEQTSSLRLVCINNDQTFEMLMPDANRAGSVSARSKEHLCTEQGTSAHGAEDLSASPAFLYEPNASIMKAGCFVELAQCYPIVPVADNSHLFLSADEIADFPGRRFKIEAISSMNKKELSRTLSPLKSANIAVRNFPMTAEQLRKKLKLKDGGDSYIFATTAHDGTHILYICRKIG